MMCVLAAEQNSISVLLIFILDISVVLGCVHNVRGFCIQLRARHRICNEEKLRQLLKTVSFSGQTVEQIPFHFLHSLFVISVSVRW